MKTSYCSNLLCFNVQGPSSKLCLDHELKHEEATLRKMEALEKAINSRAEKKEWLAQKKNDLSNRMEIAQRRLTQAEQSELDEDRRLKLLGQRSSVKTQPTWRDSFATLFSLEKASSNDQINSGSVAVDTNFTPIAPIVEDRLEIQVVSPQPAQNYPSTDQKCTICQEEFTTLSNTRSPHQGCRFHQNCLSKYVKTNNNRRVCPNDRKNF